MANTGNTQKPVSIAEFTERLQTTIKHSEQYKISPDIRRMEEFAHEILEQVKGERPRRTIVWLMKSVKEARRVMHRVRVYRSNRNKAGEPSWLNHVSLKLVQTQVETPGGTLVWKPALEIKHQVGMEERILRDGRSRNGKTAEEMAALRKRRGGTGASED